MIIPEKPMGWTKQSKMDLLQDQRFMLHKVRERWNVQGWRSETPWGRATGG